MQLAPSHVHISTAFPHISASPVQVFYKTLRIILWALCIFSETCLCVPVTKCVMFGECPIQPSFVPLTHHRVAHCVLCPTRCMNCVLPGPSWFPVCPTMFFCFSVFFCVLLYSSVFYLSLLAACTVSSALCPRWWSSCVGVKSRHYCHFLTYCSLYSSSS